MKINYVFVAIIGLIILIAVITNPNQDRHEEVIKNKLNSYLQESMNERLNESNNDWEQAGKAIGLMLGGALIDRIIDNLVSSDNYVIFSISKITWDGKTKIIGIGVFGNVFLTRQLNESLDEGLLKKK